MSHESHSIANGRGTGRFQLGYGANATCGHVDISLECFADLPPKVVVDWCVASDAVPTSARGQIVAYAEHYLHGYLAEHSVGSLHVAVVGASWSANRHNDPERATWIALHNAIADAKLPPVPLYEPPTVA